MDRSQIWIVAVLLVCWGNGAQAENQREKQRADHSANAVESVSLAVGLDGHYRVGRWTGIRLNEGDATDTVIQTRDGDGVRVHFKNRSSTDAPSDWIYVIPGSEAAPLALIRKGKTIFTDRLPPSGSPSRGPAMLPTDMPWSVVFGDPLGLDKIGKNELLRRAATVAVTVPKSAAGLPDDALGYDAIDLMLVTGSGTDVLSQLDRAQADAVVNWVKSGGRIVMTLGKSAPKLLQAAPWLKSLLPFDPSKIVSINPSAIETYTATQTQLDSFDGVKLPRDRGEVLVMGRTTRRTITPIASRFNVGFGTVVVIASDLDSEPFVQWPQRFDFVTAMTGDSVLPPDAADQVQSRRTAYDDLAGQLRMTLDQFTIRRGANFSVIALVLLGLIAAIGPLDYLLVNRLLGRPLLGWITFPVTAIALSTLLVWQSLPTVDTSADSLATFGQRVQCNRIEFIDIDGTSNPGIGRGESINFLYSHDAGMFDIHASPSDKLKIMTERIRSSAASFGHPGASFGGIQIALEDSRLPTYDATSDSVLDVDQPLLASLPIAPRSSKGFFHQFKFNTDVASESRMNRRPGSELLKGQLTNPLPVDLLDGMLIFRNWVYLLPTRFQSGATLSSLKELRQKNFRWLLSRQQAIESSTQTEAWNPSQTNDLRRLAEVVMFHQAVGGTTYTQLQNEPMSHLDLSGTLTGDRCILMGRLERPLTSINVDLQNATAQSQPASFQPNGNTLSLLRLVLPVDTAKR